MHHLKQIKDLFNELYNYYLKKAEEIIYKKDNLSQSDKNLYNFVKYRNTNTNIKRCIIDYIAGQTDQYFLNECVEHIREIDIEKLYK